VIVVGLVDGRVVGTDRIGSRRNDLMQAAIDLTRPPVRSRTELVPCIRGDGEPDHLLVFDLPPGEIAHANHRDEAYLRVGDETRRLSFAQRQELLYDKGNTQYEARPVPEAEISDLTTRLLTDYAQALGHPDRFRLLAARGLATGVTPTVAGWLLFSEHPQAQFPEAYIRVVRYRGNDRGTGSRQQIVGDERCEGPIPAQLDRARELITEWQPTRRALALSGRFEAVALVPRDAWIEGVVNAAVHRSYSIAGDHIRVEIFDDRIEISSPGRFPALVAVDRRPTEVTRFARNPRIARVCAELRYGQELGEGIRRMYDEMRLAGLTDPLYRQTSSSVRLILSTEPVHRDLDSQLHRQAAIVMAALREAGRLRTGELAEVLALSRPVTIDRLKRLEALGLVEWVGKSARDPRAYWCLPTRSG